MSNWPVVLLATAAVLLCRSQGDFWPVTVAKLAVLMMLFLGAVTVLGGLIVRLF
jgi:hypothetical protein